MSRHVKIAHQGSQLLLSAAALIVLSLLCPWLATAQVPTWSAPFPFVTEAVDQAGDVGGSCSLGLYSSGDPVIVYYDQSTHALKIAERVGGVWRRQFIAPVSTGFHWCALQVASNNTPHIVYGQGNLLVHLERHDGWWYADSTTIIGDLWDGAFALAPSGAVHVSAFAYGRGHIYAKRASGTWTVIDAPGQGQFSSIAVDSAGEPVICVRGVGVQVIRRSAGTWQAETVPGTSETYGTSIELDRANRPHIAWSDANGQGHYAFKDSTTWNVEDLAPLPCCAQVRSLSLTLSRLGEPLIAAISSTASPFLAYRTPSGWAYQTIYSTGGLGFPPWCSLRLDQQGFPRIAFYIAGYTDLYFAQGPAGVGVPLATEAPLPGHFSGPNPLRLSAQLQVSLTLPATANVSVRMIDAAGRECSALPGRLLSSGRHSLLMPSAGIKPGVVWLQARNETGAVVASRRLALLR